MKSPRAELYAQYIKEHSEQSNDLLKRWITALSVGNGAGVVAVFSVTKDQAPLLYILLPSAWLFFLGLVTASICSFCLVASNQKQREYWTYLDAARILDEAALEADPELTLNSSRSDRLADIWGKTAGYSAIMSATAFFIGALVPLVHLTIQALSGKL